MSFDPFAVKKWFRSDTGDINHTMTLPNGGVLVSIRCGFSSGTGSANFTCDAYDQSGTMLLARLLTVIGAGTSGADINARFLSDEIEAGAWTVTPQEILKFSWTNPNSGTMTWCLEVRWQEKVVP